MPDRELHVVGVYQGFYRSNGKGHGGKATVAVMRPGKRVTLVLTAHESVTWEVTTGPGTQLDRVILGGSRRQAVRGVPEAVGVTEAFGGSATPTAPYFTYTIDSAQFRALVEALDRTTGQTVSSFRGAYSAAPEEPFVIDRVQDDPRLSPDYPTPVPLADRPKLAFKALHFTPGKYGHETRVAYGDFTLSGPRMDSLKPAPEGVWRMAYDPSGTKHYGVAEAGNAIVEFELGKQEVRKLDLGLDVPPLNTPTDLTFDTKRARLLLNSTGCIYAYSPGTGKWSILADGFRAVTMVYHPGDDALYALLMEHEGRPMLAKLNAEGAVLSMIKLEGPVVPGSLPSGPGITGVQLIHADGRLILLASPGGHHLDSEGSVPMKKYIYLVDPRSGRMLLTWKG
jgi:hypothetical protein